MNIALTTQAEVNAAYEEWCRLESKPSIRYTKDDWERWCSLQEIFSCTDEILDITSFEDGQMIRSAWVNPNHR